jgi:hypothetical protein
MNEKKFIIIRIEEEGYDIVKTVDLNFYTENDIKNLLNSTVYVYEDSEDTYTTYKEVYDAFVKSVIEDAGYEDVMDFVEYCGYDNIEDFISTRNEAVFECYEITESGLKFRKDLSNY